MAKEHKPGKENSHPSTEDRSSDALVSITAGQDKGLMKARTARSMEEFNSIIENLLDTSRHNPVEVRSISNHPVERNDAMEGEKNLDEFTMRGKPRQRRRQGQLPRPDLPSTAEENRLRKFIGCRLEEEVVDSITEFAKATGQHRQDCIQEAIIQYLAREQPKLQR